MPYFSESDINDAKRRVREMQNRANNFVTDEPRRNSDGFNIPSQNHRKNEENTQENNKNEKNSNDDGEDNKSGQNGILDLFGDGDKSQIIILALILVLSREGADNMLILALLYLLL
ncbi:MAG: hypothetical protein ACI4V4_06580 [Eubacterium sp.]